MNNKSLTFLLSIYGHQVPLSKVEIGLIDLPTERYKRNTVRGKLDLVGECYLFVQFIIYITYTLCYVYWFNFTFHFIWYSFDGWYNWIICWRKHIEFCRDNILFHNSSLQQCGDQNKPPAIIKVKLLFTGIPFKPEKVHSSFTAFGLTTLCCYVITLHHI